jgi:alkanesulfonate monooxygenase SsuD/methylene tetrahydromethanopterin reductase-like flavin-dependent oxidoreductase (luciferase family)
MPDQRRREREVVEEAINHYNAEKLSDGRVRIRSGGHVVVDETYYKALERFARTEQESLEELPEHLSDDQWNSPYHDAAHTYTYLPVVFGITEDGNKELLRVCDLEEHAERVAEAYRDGGTIDHDGRYVYIGIDHARHGNAT